ncbi:hypothetical protein ISF_05344 [Cordyceps fumosorosea ARSEF 2679]|uniref:Uncharacterized protein n=1 Tax=Cordyceps fumosorosea (strain ARSEF 2679) TaxID=1081104 RepID=A0A167V866_CORFA|nr:hypothetical protein ISF_05344 [Cordyceps fumosorosea ARSEF 2679]OAA62335.1 hypothetical protein ISF_05344 [Cordyceps fumosorosea ARSEF 2679]
MSLPASPRTGLDANSRDQCHVFSAATINQPQFFRPFLPLRPAPVIEPRPDAVPAHPQRQPQHRRRHARVARQDGGPVLEDTGIRQYGPQRRPTEQLPAGGVDQARHRHVERPRDVAAREAVRASGVQDLILAAATEDQISELLEPHHPRRVGDPVGGGSGVLGKGRRGAESSSGVAVRDVLPEAIEDPHVAEAKVRERPGDPGRAADAGLNRVVHDEGVVGADAEPVHGRGKVSAGRQHDRVARSGVSDLVQVKEATGVMARWMAQELASQDWSVSGCRHLHRVGEVTTRKRRCISVSPGCD